MSIPNYDEMMARAQAAETQKTDIITIAKAVREGQCEIFVRPVNNGFLIYIGEFATVVATKANMVGLLIKRLFGGNLEDEAILKSLRKLMGYN